MLYKANLHCRTATRILKPIADFRANDENELYNKEVIFTKLSMQLLNLLSYIMLQHEAQKGAAAPIGFVSHGQGARFCLRSGHIVSFCLRSALISVFAKIINSLPAGMGSFCQK